MADEKQMKLTEQATEQTQLRDKTVKPEGTLPRQAQAYVITGISVVIVLAVMFSKNHAQPVSKTHTATPAIAVTEGNDRKISDFGQELTEQQRASEKTQLEAQMQAQARNVQTGSAAQARAQTDAPSNGSAQNTSGERTVPTEKPRDPILEHQRERDYNARFASNLAFAPARAEPEASSPLVPSRGTQALPANNAGTATVESVVSTVASREPSQKHPVNVNVNSARGQPYVLFEGTELETALVNRLDGDFSGPVKVMLTSPVYSHDRQHVLVPEGTFVLGETSKVQSLDQRRLAVVFHRMVMPDGYTVDLDQFRGLTQIGETGLNDQVNHHYFQMFGASIALGIIAGAAESSNPNSGLYQSGSEAYRSGTAASLSQTGTQVLDRFLNIPPTITIREGHRVKVYFTQDLLLPAYENHTLPPDI
jgi:type IV secretory pathway VirB10-like protein